MLENTKYPEPSTIHGYMKLILTKFDIVEAVPVLERFIPNRNKQLFLTKHIHFEWGNNFEIAAKLLSYLGELRK